MKTIKKAFAILMSITLLTACHDKDFDISPSAEDFFHVKHDKYFIPVLVRGNTRSRHILLFVQGGPGSNTLDFARIDYPDWKNTLEKDYAVAYYEPRGMGNRQGNFNPEDVSVDKYLEDLHKVAQVLKHKYQAEVHLLGHSFGGYLSYLYMIRYGGHGIVSKYISANGPATTDHEPGLRWKLRREFLLNVAREEMAKTNPAPIWQEIAIWCEAHPEIDTDEKRKQWGRYVEENIYLRYEEKTPQIKDYLKVAFFSSYNPLTASLNSKTAETVEMKISESLKSFVLTDHLSEISRPLLIISGRHDDVCPPEEVAYFFEKISSAEKVAVILPDAGHYSFHHQPGLFRNAIRDFIE